MCFLFYFEIFILFYTVLYIPLMFWMSPEEPVLNLVYCRTGLFLCKRVLMSSHLLFFPQICTVYLLFSIVSSFSALHVHFTSGSLSLYILNLYSVLLCGLKLHQKFENTYCTLSFLAFDWAEKHTQPYLWKNHNLMINNF